MGILNNTNEGHCELISAIIKLIADKPMDLNKITLLLNPEKAHLNPNNKTRGTITTWTKLGLFEQNEDLIGLSPNAKLFLNKVNNLEFENKISYLVRRTLFSLKENDQIIIPVCPEGFSIMGVDMFLDDILEIRSSYQVSEDTNVSIIMNRFAQNQKNNLQMLIKMNEKYKEMLSEVVIKDSAKIKEFVNNKLTLGDIKNGKELYETINSLLKELKIIK